MLRPGIKEAVQEFWKHIERRTPNVIPNFCDRDFINHALLLALAKLNQIRDGEAAPQPGTSEGNHG